MQPVLKAADSFTAIHQIGGIEEAKMFRIMLINEIKSAGLNKIWGVGSMEEINDTWALESSQGLEGIQLESHL